MHKNRQRSREMSCEEAPGVPVIGIDFGTSYSRVGVFQNGNVEIITNEDGSRTTPTYVAYTESGQRLVGEKAKRQSMGNPRNTFFNVKRLFGRPFNDEEVKSAIKQFPYTIIVKDGKPMLQVDCPGHTETLSIEGACSAILTKIKETAESFLEQKMRSAVFTVPTYYTDEQRQATKDACLDAGIEVLRIINDPTAAAFAYGLDKVANDRELRVLVFDLGGVSLEASLLIIEDGIFEVLTTSGDRKLGGVDFDDRLVYHLADEFKLKHKMNLTANSTWLSRLRAAAEQAKISLSTKNQVDIHVVSLFEDIDFSTSISRSLFEELCSDLFVKCMDPVENVLRRGKIDKKQIDQVILAGGSANIPKIQHLLKEFLDRSDLLCSIDPGEVVAYGAAKCAGVMGEVEDIVCFDVAPLSLGIETTGGLMSNIIKRHTNLPTRSSKTFSTHPDNSSAVTVRVFEGERALANDNHLLGQFDLHIPALPPHAPTITPAIEVTFDYDANCIVTVTAEEKMSGVKNTIAITTEKRLPKDGIERMMEEAERFKEEDSVLRDRIGVTNKLGYVDTTSCG